MVTEIASGTRLDELADRTPRYRDRFVDFLRALSIGVVVLGHWLVAVVYLDDGVLSGGSALNLVPSLWALTWILQVMPLFFFVGGFSNYRSWRASLREPNAYSVFVRSRMQRLLKPTLVFAVICTMTSLLLSVVSPELIRGLSEGIRFLAAPLWFLAVYVLVVALAPLMIALHDRFRIRVLTGLAAAAIVVDVVRIGFGWTAFGYLNFAFVWLFAHQLGLYYGDGTLPLRPRRFHLQLAGGGLFALIALVNSGIYSPSMVSMASQRASNTSPTSICLIAMSLWLVGLAMWARPALSRWLERRSVWKSVIAANSVIMTVFLWHLTALLLAVVTLYPLGFPQPPGGSAAWWMSRPLWIASVCLFLAPLVVIFGRYERTPGGGGVAASSTRPHLKVAVAVAMIVGGASRLAESGFDATATDGLGVDLVAQPVVSLVLMWVGYKTLMRAGASQGN